MFVQDQWTIDKLTLTGGLRYDWLSYYYPATFIGPGTAGPDRNFTTDAEGIGELEGRDAEGRGRVRPVWQRQDGHQGGHRPVCHQRRTPGNSTAPANPITGAGRSRPTGHGPMPTATSPRLRSAEPPGARQPGSGGDFCGCRQPEFRWTACRRARTIRPPTTDGARAPTTGSSRPASSTRWCRGSRSRSGTSAASSATSSIQDNLATVASDYTPFSITAPLDPRLPGRRRLYRWAGCTISTRTRSGRSDNLVTFCRQLREIHRALERRRLHGQRAAAGWCRAAGRRQHGADVDRPLRGAATRYRS